MSSRRQTPGTRILSGVTSAVIGVLAVIALLLVVLGFVARPGSDGISRVAGHPVLTVLSGSMRPTLNPGDLIVDNPLTRDQAARLAIGNIITFHVSNTSSSNLITHRIVAIDPAGGPDNEVTYQTKGDANNAPDVDPVRPEQIVGTYRSRIPFGGYVLQDTQNKTVFLWIICAALLVFVVAEIGKRWNTPRSADAGDDGAERVADAPADREQSRSEPTSPYDPSLDHQVEGAVEPPASLVASGDAMPGARSDAAGDRTPLHGDISGKGGSR